MFFFSKMTDKKLFRKVTIYHNPTNMMYLLHFCHFGNCLIANTRQNKKKKKKKDNNNFEMTKLQFRYVCC